MSPSGEAPRAERPSYLSRAPLTSGRLPSYGGLVRGLAIGALLFVGGCSLQGLDDLTPPFTACTGTPDCETLNERDDIAADTCQRWVCVEDFCRLRRPGTVEETCNGADDDCDTHIDESGDVIAPVVVLHPPAALHAITSSRTGAIASFLDAPSDTVWRASVRGTAEVGAVDARFATSESGASAPTPGCVGTESSRACAIASASIARVEGDLEVVVARVARDDGPIRIGPVTADAITLSGGDARSSLWDGIDGANTTRVAIVASPFDRGRTPTALVATVADDSMGARVALLGVWIERDPSGLRWAHGTDTGRVLALDPRAAGDVGPSLAALSDGRFLVAYAASPSGIAWHLVASLSESAPRCMGTPTQACITADDEGLVTQVPISASETRTSAALLLEARGVLDAVAPSHVAIAASTIEGSDDVALAYLERDEVVLVPGTWSTSLVFDLGGTRRVSAPGARDLSLVHVPSGLATGADGRGWVVAWSTNDGTYVARLAEGEATIRASFLGDPSDQPHPFVDDTGHVSVLAGQPEGLVVFPHACGPTR